MTSPIVPTTSYWLPQEVPRDVWAHVFEYVVHSDYVNSVMKVCKLWKEIIIAHCFLPYAPQFFYNTIQIYCHPTYSILGSNQNWSLYVRTHFDQISQKCTSFRAIVLSIAPNFTAVPWALYISPQSFSQKEEYPSIRLDWKTAGRTGMKLTRYSNVNGQGLIVGTRNYRDWEVENNKGIIQSFDLSESEININHDQFIQCLMIDLRDDNCLICLFRSKATYIIYGYSIDENKTVFNVNVSNVYGFSYDNDFVYFELYDSKYHVFSKDRLIKGEVNPYQESEYPLKEKDFFVSETILHGLKFCVDSSNRLFAYDVIKNKRIEIPLKEEHCSHFFRLNYDGTYLVYAYAKTIYFFDMKQMKYVFKPIDLEKEGIDDLARFVGIKFQKSKNYSSLVVHYMNSKDEYFSVVFNPYQFPSKAQIEKDSSSRPSPLIKEKNPLPLISQQDPIQHLTLPTILPPNPTQQFTLTDHSNQQPIPDEIQKVETFNIPSQLNQETKPSSALLPGPISNNSASSPAQDSNTPTANPVTDSTSSTTPLLSLNHLTQQPTSYPAVPLPEVAKAPEAQVPSSSQVPTSHPIQPKVLATPQPKKPRQPLYLKMGRGLYNGLRFVGSAVFRLFRWFFSGT